MHFPIPNDIENNLDNYLHPDQDDPLTFKEFKKLFIDRSKLLKNKLRKKMLTNTSNGYFWWYIKDVNYGICYVLRGKVVFFTVGNTVEEKKIEECTNLTFIPCIVPSEITNEKV